MVFLIINLGCTFMSAYYFASFVDVFSDFSYRQGCNIIIKLAFVFCVQLMCTYIKNRYWIAYKERMTNELECSIYEKYLSSSVKLNSESKLSVICERDISECVNFHTETIPLAH